MFEVHPSFDLLVCISFAARCKIAWMRAVRDLMIDSEAIREKAVYLEKHSQSRRPCSPRLYENEGDNQVV